jgi:CheY-like chemotaxis protein
MLPIVDGRNLMPSQPITNILVVDDQKTVAELLTTVVRSRGYPTCTAESGQDALLKDANGKEVAEALASLVKELLSTRTATFSRLQPNIRAMAVGTDTI